MPQSSHVPQVFSQQEHGIQKSQISSEALFVLDTLIQGGYEAYLVGGCVRDLLCGIIPTDFDVCTNALPEEVKALFKHCLLIGRRFRLAHVYVGREVIEVATFRGSGAIKSAAGVLVDDNVYGTLEEDALRRDFTVNALYYSGENESILDYTGGFQDLKQSQFRVIGDPMERYREDPVRMLRAIRLISQLDLTPDSSVIAGIKSSASLLSHVSDSRLFEELGKLLLRGKSLEAVRYLVQYHLFEQLLPAPAQLLSDPAHPLPGFFEYALKNSDLRVKEKKPLNPAFLLAVFLWPIFQERIKRYVDAGRKLHVAKQFSMEETLSRHSGGVVIPKRFAQMIREIWILQYHLARRTGKRAFHSVRQARFRAAYDFLLLRAQSGEPVHELADWWTEFQTHNEKGQKEMVLALETTGKKA